MAQILLSRGARINAKANGATALRLAVKAGHKGVADLIRGRGGTE
jgi:hypothetical protein